MDTEDTTNLIDYLYEKTKQLDEKISCLNYDVAGNSTDSMDLLPQVQHYMKMFDQLVHKVEAI